MKISKNCLEDHFFAYILMILVIFENLCFSW